MMGVSRRSGIALGVALFALAGAASAEEIKGAAILNHPCGKVAVQHMALAHAGKMAEATKLGTKEMQAQWAQMPAKDRDMMTEMIKATAQPEPQFSNSIKSNGVLSVQGKTASLTVKVDHKDANGSSSETWAQKYVIDGGSCLITH
jgi:hypothetical protein